MNLNLEQFEKMYMGRVVRDGQCVALFRQYVESCFGIPHTGSVEGAINLWSDYDQYPAMLKYFDKVSNAEDLRVGDCPIFGITSTNKYGHVAIITDVHEDGISVVEQDGFKLNGMKPSFWTFRRFVGALRPKDASQWGK